MDTNKKKILIGILAIFTLFGCGKTKDSGKNTNAIKETYSSIAPIDLIQGEIRHVLVIGIDGLGSNNLKPDPVYGLQAPFTPVLSKILPDSAYTMQAKIDEINISGPNWMGIMTSSPSSVHGVLNNNCQKGARMPTLFDHLKSLEHQEKKIIHKALVGDWDVLFCYAFKRSSIEFPYLSDSTQETFEAAQNYLSSDTIDSDNYSLTFVYFGDADNRGHRYGGNSVPYNNEVNQIDKMIGYMIQLFRNKGLWDNGAIIITSDHGHGFLTRKHTDSDSTVPFVIYSPHVKPFAFDDLPKEDRPIIRNNFVSSVAAKLMGFKPNPSWIEMVDWLE